MEPRPKPLGQALSFALIFILLIAAFLSLRSQRSTDPGVIALSETDPTGNYPPPLDQPPRVDLTATLKATHTVPPD